jgi:hypothetical protein
MLTTSATLKKQGQWTMGDPTPSVADSFGGMVVLAFELADSEIHKSPERIAEILRSPALVDAVKTQVLRFAKNRDPGASTSVSVEESQKLSDAILDGLKDSAKDEYLKLIKASAKYQSLETQLKLFEKAAKSSALGVWVDANKTTLYIVGATLALGAGVALYITKPTGPVMAAGIRELEKLKFEIVKVGILKLGVSNLVFEPKAEKIGGKLTGQIKWEKLTLDFALQALAKSANIEEVGGEIAVKYSTLNFSAVAKKDMKKPTFDLALKVQADFDQFHVGVAALYKDQTLGGRASVDYDINKRLSLGASYERSGASTDRSAEDKGMVNLTFRFP